MKPTHIIIHHTATDRDKTTLSSVDMAHKKRGFPKGSRGYYVGYHFLFLHDGFVQTRDENEVGAHALGGWNMRSIGMCFTGNFDLTTELTYSQTENFKKIAQIVMEANNIPIENVVLHRDVWATACPGKNIDLQFIHNLLKKNPMYQFQENALYQAVGSGASGKFGIYVGGRLLVDDTDKVLATFIMRNNGNTGGKAQAVTQEVFDSAEHYNLKGEKL